MKKFTHTRTALASLLTLCSFSSFAADSFNESMKEVKKQENTESTITSEKMEVMKTSNKRLKEKMDRICNADPRKKAEEIKKKEELKLAAQKKKEELTEKKKRRTSLASEKKIEPLNARNSNVESSKARGAKTQKARDVEKDLKKDVKVVNQNVEKKGKTSPVVSVSSVDVVDTNQGISGLKITFGGVVDAQGYGKAGPSDENYKRYNVMSGKSTGYYEGASDRVKGVNPIFPSEIGNIGDYSEDMGMIADAILHLRAENKNEDKGLLYGADVQFQVPVTEGRGASQGVRAARGRSAHVFLSSKYGDLKLGYQFGPEALMRLDATRIATIDGAADSDWFRKVNLEGSAASFPFYVTPRLYTESFSSESEKLSFRMAGKYHKDVMAATLPFRVAYYSPSYVGARFGVSYSPRYNNNLFVIKDGDDIKHVGPGYEHIVSAGVSYEYDFSKREVKVKVAAVGEYGQAKEPDSTKYAYREYVEYNNLMGVNLGISADYNINENQGVKFATSFAYLGKSGQPMGIEKLVGNAYQKIDGKGVTDDDKRVKGLEDQFKGDDKNTMYWTAGAGYQHENFYTSLTYFGSKMSDGDKLHDVAFGIQYDLSPACSKGKFVPYASLHYFKTDEKQGDGYKITKKDSSDIAPSNQGVLFLTGMKFSF
ncbi:porin [Wolbachia endosymbiont of Litomosoides brasiliensis]|uniref:WD0745 family porin n=1 Tax=Wolbachia endosymbiont of Litomosoides brasiliensis TaxID=1812117 RepID=UPI00158DBE50|nr:porin [Wolbachia endosymbiont of Litomosoides brasiliensis]NUY39747.1 porin [Wolbachia endosymbiont of Litomosoides brasiliensis]